MPYWPRHFQPATPSKSAWPSPRSICDAANEPQPVPSFVEPPPSQRTIRAPASDSQPCTSTSARPYLANSTACCVAPTRSCRAAPSSPALVSMPRGSLELYDRPLLVTVMGEFNSGKSTFVNALLGEEVAPMGITPTTATINLLKYGREQGPASSIATARAAACRGRCRPSCAASIRRRQPAFSSSRCCIPSMSAARQRRRHARPKLDPARARSDGPRVHRPGRCRRLAVHRRSGRQAQRARGPVGDPRRRQADPSASSTRSIGCPSWLLAWLGRDGRRGTAAWGQPLDSILAHLRDSDSGLVELLEAIVPFSSREAMLGRKSGDVERMRRANLPALEQALEERFFQRAQAIKAGRRPHFALWHS